MSAEAQLSPARVLWLLAGLVALAIVAFMTTDVSGNWDFVLPFRGKKVLTMLLVAYAVAVSTVLFQTATENRLLTPAIMGFDSLYVLLQTCLIFFMGSQAALALDARLRFGVEACLMVLFSGVLHRWLFLKQQRSLHLLVLAGVVLGALFRSLSSFFQRVIDPNEFAFLQDRFFATFNNPDQELLIVTGVATLVVSLWGLRTLAPFDVLGLGREPAVSLGVDHRRVVSRILIVVAVLISVSTALVGPVTFFGLLVASIAHTLVPSFRHRHLLPAAWFIAAIALIGGQLVLEQVLALNANLKVVIEFAGGITFIILLLRGAAR